MAETQRTLTSTKCKAWLIYARQQSSLFSRVSTNIIREVCSYLSSVYVLPSISANTLHLFNLETRSSVTFPLAHSFTNGAVYCFYRERHLLCVGGNLPSKEVLSFDIDAGGLSTLQKMQFERAWPGIVAFQNAMYVFGGNTDPSLESCEAMNICTTQWRRLSDMHSPKVAFSPTVYRTEIFLMCPMLSPNLFEAFNPTTENFRVLPASLTLRLYGCLSFLTDDSIKILTFGRKLITFNLDSMKETERITAEGQHDVLSNTPVVIYQQQVWWVNYSDGRVIRFDIATNSIRHYEL